MELLQQSDTQEEHSPDTTPTAVERQRDRTDGEKKERPSSAQRMDEAEVLSHVGCRVLGVWMLVMLMSVTDETARYLLFFSVSGREAARVRSTQSKDQLQASKTQ